MRTMPLSHIILILQTYDQTQLIDITDLDEADQSTFLTISFDHDMVPYSDLKKKLNLLNQHYIKQDLTLEDSKTHPARKHVITAAEAESLVKYFNEADDVDTYKIGDFNGGRTIEDVGKALNSQFEDETIHHIICHLFGYNGVA